MKCNTLYSSACRCRECDKNGLTSLLIDHQFLVQLKEVVKRRDVWRVSMHLEVGQLVLNGRTNARDVV